MPNLSRADRRLGALAGQFDSFRKKARDDSSLPGGMTGDRRGMADKRSSWSCDEVAAMMDSFKPASVTLSPFYKQVNKCWSQDQGHTVHL